MGIDAIFAYAVAMALLALSPGPGVMAVIAQTMAKGAKAGFLILSGMVVSDITFLLASIYGLSSLAAQMGEFFYIVKIAGAAYLIYLGWATWVSKLEAKAASAKLHKGKSFATGIAIGLGNPKAIVFYLALLPAFIDLTVIQPSDVLLITAVTIVVLYLVVGSYVLGAAKLKKAVSTPTAQKRFNRITGSLLIGAGATIAARS